MVKKLLLVIACAVITGGLWYALEKTHPVFVAEEAMAAGRQAGGLTEEWINDIRQEDLKSAMLSFAIWGSVLAGFSGLLCNLRGNRRFLGLAVGLVLGALGGATGAYAGQWHDLSTEYTGATTTYWIIRWVILGAPMALAAAFAAAASGNFPKDVVDSSAGGLIGAVIAVTLISLLMGVLTPVESHQYIYPAFPASRLLALMSINVAVVLLIIVQLSRNRPKAGVLSPETPLPGPGGG